MDVREVYCAYVMEYITSGLRVITAVSLATTALDGQHGESKLQVDNKLVRWQGIC